MMNALERIVVHKRKELTRLRAEHPPAEVQARARDAPAPRDFAAALGGPTVAVIAEIKRASPSAGTIRAHGFEPGQIAGEYQAGGAAALSVLTDQEFFHGSLEHLQQARGATGLPALRKDFVIDEYQVYEARAAGASEVAIAATRRE